MNGCLIALFLFRLGGVIQSGYRLLLLEKLRDHGWLVRARLGLNDTCQQALLADIVLLVRLDNVVDQWAVLR